MDDDNDSEQRALLGWILGIAVALSITVALSSGIVATMQPSAKARGAIAPEAGAAAPVGVAPSAAVASIAVSVVRIHFASGATALPPEADAALKPIADAAKARAASKLVVSGYHDTTGDPARNAELAKQRAFAVRDALVANGIATERIELRRPQVTAGGSDDREARRVEVGLE